MLFTGRDCASDLQMLDYRANVDNAVSAESRGAATSMPEWRHRRPISLLVV